MLSDHQRPARPLDPKAAVAADEALYTAHQKDVRPNALFDAAGNKKPLSTTDPAQECLRDEWVEHYGKNGGKIEQRKPRNENRPGEAIQKCPCQKATLSVNVRYRPLDAPVKDVTVSIKGPTTKSLFTDASGNVKFTDLFPGKYEITTKYGGKNVLADLAISKVGSTAWAYAKERSPFPEDSNKCNLFVHEMVTGAGFTVPQKPHKKLYGLGSTVMLPLNAGDWASATKSIGSSRVVSNPEPGDVIAWSHPEYTDATGHVGIVTYPLPSAPQTKDLSPGDNASVTMIMRRQVVGANDTKVEEDTYHFWHFYDEGNTNETGRIIFRRMSK